MRITFILLVVVALFGNWAQAEEPRAKRQLAPNLGGGLGGLAGLLGGLAGGLGGLGGKTPQQAIDDAEKALQRLNEQVDLLNQRGQAILGLAKGLPGGLAQTANGILEETFGSVSRVLGFANAGLGNLLNLLPQPTTSTTRRITTTRGFTQIGGGGLGK